MLFAIATVALLLLFLFCNHVIRRPERITRLETLLLTTIVELISYAAMIAVGTVGSGGDLAVMFVWCLLFMQIMFDLPVRQNFCIVLAAYVAFIALSGRYKSSENYTYDIMHATLSAIIGLYCSYKKTQAQMSNLVYKAHLQEANYELYHTSTTDELTGLPNRRKVFEQMRELATSCPADTRIACVVMDVDEFKRYNDIYGHPAGDEVLRRIGSALEAFAREQGIVIGRIGGEEFLSAWRTESQDGVYAKAEALRNTVYALDIAHEGMAGGRLTASAGVCCVRLEQIERAYPLADKAVYRAKEEGRNRTCEMAIEESGPQKPVV